MLPPTKGEIRNALISAADWTVARTPLGRPIRRRYGGRGCVFMLHSVLRDPAEHLMRDTSFALSGLRSVLALCRAAGIDVVTLDEAMRRLAGREERPFVVMTFDDGYRDNLRLALPLFEEFRAPLTVFVTTGMVERSLHYWWGGLLALVRREASIEVEALGRRIGTASPREKAEALRWLSRWVGADVAARSEALRPTFRRYRIDLPSLLDADALSRSELQRLSRSDLVTIGGHTTTHRPLASLGPEEALADVKENRDYLAALAQAEIRHFAYPHGDRSACGPRDAAIVRAAGYATASSTLLGSLFSQHAALPYMLPRNLLSPRRDAGWNVRSQLMGAHRFLASRGGPPIDPRTVPPTGPGAP